MITILFYTLTLMIVRSAKKWAHHVIDLGRMILYVIVLICYIFVLGLLGDSLFGFLVDSYDTVWYMTL